MPDIQIEKESKFKKLSKDDRDELAKKISDWWEQFHKKRNTQLTTAETLKKYMFLNQPDRNADEDDKWRSNIKENKIYTTWDSMKSTMWKEIYSNEEQMFDVMGTSKEYEEVADKQKQAVTHALKAMNASLQFDIATDNWGIYGDFIYKTDWKTRKKKVKRYDQFRGLVEQELPIEENANVEAINPMFFNFDVTKYKYGDKESWDSCPKIYKRFASLEEIKKNPLYTLTKEQEQELDIDDETKTTEHKSDDNLATAKKYGELYEVLYLHGDIKFNGKLYKNIVAEVLAGKFLIFFDENPIYINPFVFDATQIDPETGRGISPLKCILEMCISKENLLNKAGDIAEFNANPCMWGTDTFLKDKYKNGNIPYRPGKYLEYEATYNAGFPQPVKFDSAGLADMISVLANDISDTSSVNANAMGNVEQGKKTATDLNLAKAGSDSRTAMKLDKIYQINLKVITNVAELLAMFKIEPETLLVNDKGKRVSVEIDNAIRQGSYQYVYEDRNALIDRRSKFQEIYQVIQGTWDDPDVSYEKQEIIKTAFEMVGFDAPDKFFAAPSPFDQLAKEIKQMPEEVQQIIMQQIQQTMQKLQEQQKITEMQNQANEQVQMQMMREQARANAEAEQMGAIVGNNM